MREHVEKTNRELQPRRRRQEGEVMGVNVVKYLASYLTGGPISERRLISSDENEVVFWARPKRSKQRSKG